MIPIITYHALGEAKSPVFTAVSRFEEQLAALTEAGYKSVSLGKVIEWLGGEAEMPVNGIVLTFDDGYESVFSQARPLMAKYGFAGTIFVISDYCGRNNQWPGQMRGIPERPLMGWEQLGALAAEGWELGSHSRTHPNLSQLGHGQLEDEITGSQEKIFTQTGIKTRLFAQPYGKTNQEVDQIVRERFAGAVNTRLGLVREGNSSYHLPRIDAYYLGDFLIKLLNTPTGSIYLSLREGLRQVRRR
jgi:peptidoglycan/xylan/chitin deacetylase (PgdA/CDA1 family)